MTARHLGSSIARRAFLNTSQQVTVGQPRWQYDYRIFSSLDDVFLVAKPWMMMSVVTIVVQIPLDKVLQPSVKICCSLVIQLSLSWRDVGVGKGASPFRGIFLIFLMPFVLRYFSRMSIKVGTVIGEVLLRSKIWSCAGPIFFSPLSMLLSAVSRDATHPFTMSSA